MLLDFLHNTVFGVLISTYPLPKLMGGQVIIGSLLHVIVGYGSEFKLYYDFNSIRYSLSAAITQMNIKDHGARANLDIFAFSAQSFAQQFKMEKAKVIRISGIGNYNEYEIDNTTVNEEEAAKE